MDPDPGPGKPPPEDTQRRAAAIAALLELQHAGHLTDEHVANAARAFDRSPFTIRRWLRKATAQGRDTRTRARFVLTPQMRDAIARWRGNATAAYRELTEEQALGLPSAATFHRAVNREISPGHRAGLRQGERARRSYDIAGKRPRHHRNYAWETDHVEASVNVVIDGVARKPWVTWFVDASTDGICGMAVTPHRPSREAVLAAIRDAMLRDDAHGPFGGIPERVRVDGGREFLCTTVTNAFGAFGVRITVLIDDPEGKPAVEAVNGAVKKTLFAGLPGYTHAPTVGSGKPVDPHQPLLPFEAFVALLRNWVNWWNFENTIKDLGDRTPAQAWLADHTHIRDVDPAALHTYTLERRGKALTINNDGVHWRKRHYIADWMHGYVGEKVDLRYMPHHDHRVELYEPGTGRHLGSAFMAEQATREQIRALKRGAGRAADRLRAELVRTEKSRNTRFAATTDAAPPQPLDAMTEQEALDRLRSLGAPRERELPAPGTVPLPPPAAHWAVPRRAAPAPDPADPARRTDPAPADDAGGNQEDHS